jgi:hypothetical protein
MKLPRKETTFEALYWGICDLFQVEGVTIMSGDKFIFSQQELDEVLASEESPTYHLTIYDSYPTEQQPSPTDQE